MTDFDIIARLRKLELEVSRLKDRLAALEGKFPPPEYDGHMPDPAPIWPVKDDLNA
jgi:hypothetical protein